MQGEFEKHGHQPRIWVFFRWDLGTYPLHACLAQHPLCSWQRHAETETLWQVLAYIRATKPRCGVLENVQGIKACAPPDHKSALSVIQDELSNMGYASHPVDMDLQHWHQAVRQRHCVAITHVFFPVSMSSQCDLGLVCQGTSWQCHVSSLDLHVC